MLIGYVRVSTAEQNSARQEVLMRELSVEKVYLDKASGKNANRPQLQEMLAFARQGDTIVVESISRFARNTRVGRTKVDANDFRHIQCSPLQINCPVGC